MAALLLTLTMALLGLLIAERRVASAAVRCFFLRSRLPQRRGRCSRSRDLGWAHHALLQPGADRRCGIFGVASRLKASAGDASSARPNQPPAVAQQLWDQREDLIKDGRLAGREQWVTVLISDTCSFTGLSEQLPPQA